jgi:putative DNA primase/helicase
MNALSDIKDFKGTPVADAKCANCFPPPITRGGRYSVGKKSDGSEVDAWPELLPYMMRCALKHADYGLPVFPCSPKNKRPVTKHGFKDASRNPLQIQDWWTTSPNALIGIPMGEASGLFAVDLDRKPGKGDGIATWQALIEEHGDAPTCSVKTPSTGRHLIYNWRPGIRNVPLGKLGAGIEIKGEGGYIIAAPSELNGKSYEWENELPAGDPPDWLVRMILDRGARVERSPSDELAALAERHAGAGVSAAPADLPAPADPQRIRAALAAIDPDIERGEWIAIGAALFKELGEDAGFEAWNEWSSTGNKYSDRRRMEAEWRPIIENQGYGWTIATVFHHAKEADPDWWRNVEAPQADEAPANDSGAVQQRAEKPEPPLRSYHLVRASDVIMRPTDWLWKGHLQRGAQEITTGLPGGGKSQAQISLIACATTGKPWPDGYRGGPAGNVIMLTAEDTLEQVVVPRLTAAGANLDRVHILKKIKRDKRERMFLLGEDLQILAQIIDDLGDVLLVTIDPITAYMGGKLDAHKVTDVRNQLGPLAELAERKNVAFSTITHPPKNAGSRAIDHFIGSQAFIAAARIGHVVIEEVDGEDKRTGRMLFTNPKNNPHQKMPTLAFRKTSTTVGRDEATGSTISAAYVTWEGTVDISADEAVAATMAKATGKRTDAALAFLIEVLAGGPVPMKDIEERGAQRGLNVDQLKRAKGKLGIISDKSGFEGAWVWAMPKDRDKMPF